MKHASPSPAQKCWSRKSQKCFIERMASGQDKEQRVGGHHVCVGTEHDPEERTGVMGSVMRAVHSAKEAVVGKIRDEHGRRDEDVDDYAGDGGDRSREEMTQSAAGAMDEKATEAARRASEAKERAKERTGEMTEKTKETAGETKDYMTEKARVTAEKTKETAESAADKTKEKAQEAKEKTNETAHSVVDKTKETTQTATSKLGELKGKAMGLFSGKKEDAKEQKYATSEEKLRETEEDTRRRMEELRLKGRDEYEGDVAQRVREDKDESERRGGGILGALGSLKEKLTSHPNPSDPDRSRPVDKPRTREEKQVVVEDVSSGAVESPLKASEQASGKTFNEVGRIDDEGVVRLDRRGK